MLQFGDVDGLPAFGGPYQDGIDQLQTAFLGKETRQGFGPPALLDKGALNQVGRPDKFTMGPRQLLMIQQSVQVFTEDTAQRGQLLAKSLEKILGRRLSCIMARGITDGLQVRFDFRPA